MSKQKHNFWDISWSPWTGCSHASAACFNCWAEMIKARFGCKVFDCTDPTHEIMHVAAIKEIQGRLVPRWLMADGKPKIVFHEDRVHKPLHIKKPSRFFVCDVSDFFHPLNPGSDELRFEVMEVCKRAYWHDFIFITKRASAVLPFQRKFYPKGFPDNFIIMATLESTDPAVTGPALPYGGGNPWLRAHDLVPVKCKAKGLIMEPMLGPVDLPDEVWEAYGRGWCILGGESDNNMGIHGAGIRDIAPMKKEWAEAVIAKCDQYGIKVYFKQWGSFDENGVFVGPKQKAGKLWDGLLRKEFPRRRRTR